MRRIVSVAVAVVLVGGLAGVASAWGPGGGMWGAGGGPGWMMGGRGPGWMMGDGPGAGPGGCPGWAAFQGQNPATGEQGTAAPAQISEDQAKQIASEYAQKYFQGYSVERVLPFTGRFRTMYQVELKGPKGETRTLHITPWGGVRPFGGPVVGQQG